MDREALRVLLEQGESVERIAARFRRHPSTVAYWIAKHGLVANGQQRHAARGGLDREQLEALVEQGLSITEIAAAVERSKATVRHWLKKYGLRTLNTQRRVQRKAAYAAAAADESEPPWSCGWSAACTERPRFVREGSGYFRCRRCRSESVSQHRRRLKEVLVREAGGRCIICGYDRQPRALEFHHVDPAAKAFALSRRGITLSLQALRAEARKCVLLCSNCHAEVESGCVALPDTVARGSSHETDVSDRDPPDPG